MVDLPAPFAPSNPYASPACSSSVSPRSTSRRQAASVRTTPVPVPEPPDNRPQPQDPRLTAATWQNLRDIFAHQYWWPSLESHLYRPVTTLTYWVNYTVFGSGGAPFGAGSPVAGPDTGYPLDYTAGVGPWQLLQAVAGQPFSIPQVAMGLSPPYSFTPGRGAVLPAGVTLAAPRAPETTYKEVVGK